MSESPMKTAGVYRAFFKRALADARATVEAYEQDVRDWYEDGDGQSPNWVRADTQPWFEPEYTDPGKMVNIGGRGYRYPHCIHGMSLWTDYDNICGGCEDSETVFDTARARAREAWLRFCYRWDWYQSAPGDFQYQLPGAHEEVLAWVMNQFKDNT